MLDVGFNPGGLRAFRALWHREWLSRPDPVAGISAVAVSMPPHEGTRPTGNKCATGFHPKH